MSDVLQAEMSDNTQLYLARVGGEGGGRSTLGTGWCQFFYIKKIKKTFIKQLPG